MHGKWSFWRTVSLILVICALLGTGVSTSAQSINPPASQVKTSPSPLVVQIYYSGVADLNYLASFLDVWEVHHEASYLLALISPAEFSLLEQSGYRMSIDQAKTDLLNKPFLPLPGQGTNTIPGYSCYRTVEETFASMQNLAASHPDLAEIIDIGDSWDKVTAGGPAGYDLLALQLTNENFGNISGKPTFFLVAETHAREFTTAETAMRFAEYLVGNYGTDPDVTWLLDYFRVYIVPMSNPDGRKFAESGILWRKNTDNDDGFCFYADEYGTDLNRNHSFKWNMGGSSNWQCSEIYHGPSAGSEPEVQAIESFVKNLFPDQRGSGDNDAAPADTMGMFITLHSYGQLVLWPWGYTYLSAPNNTQLQTLGRHLAFFNNYDPQQSYQLYQTSGTSEEFAYGELGVAGYTFEMGTAFFQSCSTFESTIYPANLNALIYSFKSARRPYQNPSGPDILNASVNPASVEAGIPVELSATADDTRYKNSQGTEPTQNIAEIRYSVDSPSWIAGVNVYPMTASDGSFNSNVESAQATIDTAGLPAGKHLIFIEGKDSDNNWGVISAVFLNITTGSPVAEFTSDSPVSLGQLIHFVNQTTGADPLSYTWNFGDGVGTSTNANPAYEYLAPGTYPVTLTASNAFGADTVVHNVLVYRMIYLPLSIK